MFNENHQTKTHAKESLGFTMNEGNELMNRSFIGEYTDTIYHADGTVEVREGRNTIVNGIGKLIACLLKKHEGYSGLGYWAVGSGSEGWDNQSPTPAQPTDTKCTAEIGRKVINPSDIKFLDESNRETETVTNKIQVTVTFAEGDCNGTWREFALFGGNATSAKDSGIAINHKTHPIMVKTSSMVVERKIRFTFN